MKSRLSTMSRWTAVVVLSLLVPALTACGGQAAPTSVPAPSEPELAQSAPEFEPSYVDSSAFDNAEALADSYADNRMIIRSADMSLIVADTDDAIDQITTIAADNGGYLLDSQVWSASGDRKDATLTIAVRAENFDTTLRRLRDVALEVERESSSGQDVSTEYVDLESRLHNLEATRDRVRGFLDDADSTEDALEVNATLAELEEEIDLIKGRMQYLAGRSAYSTISITLSMPLPEQTARAWSLGSVVRDASRRQVNTFQVVSEALVRFIIVPLPYLVILGLIGYGVYEVRRRWMRRNASAPAVGSTRPGAK